MGTFEAVPDRDPLVDADGIVMTVLTIISSFRSLTIVVVGGGVAHDVYFSSIAIGYR